MSDVAASANASTNATEISLEEKWAAETLGSGSEYIEYLLAGYYRNLLRLTDHRSPLAYNICSTFELHDGAIEGIKNFPAGKKEKKTVYSTARKPPANKVNKADWDNLTQFFENKLSAWKTPPVPDMIFRNLELMGQRLHYGDLEIDILRFLIVRQKDFQLSIFADQFIKEDAARIGAAMALFTGRVQDGAKIRALLDAGSTFIKSGIINVSQVQEEGGFRYFPELEDDIIDFLTLAKDADTGLVDMLIGKPLDAKLNIDDFSYLADDIALIAGVIKSAKEKKRTGVNIMLYGPAGSGKTELAKAIVSHLGMTLYGIGEDLVENGESSTPDATSKQRVSKLFQAHSFLADSSDAVLLFDEVEDLLIKGNDADKKAEPPSKIIVNRLLENNPVPTIWAGNDPDKFHDSMRQRFSFSLYVDYPPMEMRRNIWARQLSMNEETMSDQDLTYLARHYRAPGRMIANAVQKSADIGSLKVATIENFLRASSHLTNGDIESIESGAGLSDKFDISLVNYDDARQNEIGALAGAGSRVSPYAILMSGPVGGGLRSFGRYMAEKAVLNQLEVDVRALIAPHPMMSAEVRIRQAFDVARNQKQLLVFSHLDALAEQPDNSAANNWKSDESEFFMESLMRHRLPVIAHSYRSSVEFPEFMTDCFSVQAKVTPLDDEQRAKAFKLYFAETIKSSQNDSLPDGLVPGDFAAVQKILRRSTNGHTEPARIAELLARQPTYRAEADKKRFGFTPGRA